MLSRQLIIYFLLCLVSIVMVKEFTFRPTFFSGNGNPVILLFPFVFLTFLLFGIEWCLRLKRAAFQKQTWGAIFFISFALLIISTIFEFFFAKELLEQLGGPPTNIDSRIYRFPWLNQYTNTLYVNLYTFILFVSVLTSVISFFQWRKRKI